MPKSAKQKGFFLLLVTILCGAATPQYSNEPPPGFVRLTDEIPTIQLDIRYHTADNFTGAPLPGYGVQDAWLLKAVANALKLVQLSLSNQGKGLLVYDAYRPRRGTLGMVAWTERTGQMDLVKNGYIARYSGHNHGHTVDLTIIDLATGKPLDMGTPWDTLDTRSHTYNVKGEALENRLLLKREMEAAGFRYYYKEWWHFSMKVPHSKSRDVPYACFEPPEGKWRPQEGWNQPGFVMPATWTPSPCQAHP